MSENSLALAALDLPPNQFGLFLVSSTQGFVPMPGGSQGNLCVVGQIGRYTGPGQVSSTGSTGTLFLPVDLTQTPSPAGPFAIQSGTTWNFQAWYRDFNPGPTSNFSTGLSLSFQ